MKSFHTVLMLLFLFLSNACVHSTAPRNNADFARPEGIQAFTGCYQNLGEGGASAPQRFLSAVIWPEAKLDHSRIKVMRVVAADAKTLRVIAEAQGTILHESLFVEGKDFRLNSGRIKVKGEPQVSFAFPAGNVFIGLGYESQEMGIDASGDGKLQEAGTFAGTAFFIIPIAGHIQDSFRFPKVQELCNGS